MMTIDQILGELLLRHNCVIVPSFGGFVAREMSAKIDYKTGKMSPPSKSLLFNKQLVNNDGLLIAEYANKCGITYDASALEIKQVVEGWNTTLRQGGRVELDKIGHIFLDVERNLRFEQDRFFNLLLDSFGLGQVHFVSEEDVKIIDIREETLTVVKEDEVERKDAKIITLQPKPQNQEPNVPVVQAKKRSSVIKYIAAACILPIAFYSVWIPMKTDVLESGVISINDFNPFKNIEGAKYESEEVQLPSASGEETVSLKEQVKGLEEGINSYTYAFTPGINLSVELKSNTDQEPLQDESTSNEAIQASSMHFIVGCFSMEENADNLVSKLQGLGFDAQVVDIHNGLHRVSAGGAMSIEGLNKIKSTAQANGFNGWILK